VESLYDLVFSWKIAEMHIDEASMWLFKLC